MRRPFVNLVVISNHWAAKRIQTLKADLDMQDAHNK